MILFYFSNKSDLKSLKLIEGSSGRSTSSAILPSLLWAYNLSSFLLVRIIDPLSLSNLAPWLIC